MVATVSPYVTVLSAFSPLVVGKRRTDSVQVSPTTLTPFKQNENANDIAYTFSAPANIALLSRPAASVLLTAQAGEPPAILKQHSTPPPGTDNTARTFLNAKPAQPDVPSFRSRNSAPVFGDFSNTTSPSSTSQDAGNAFSNPGSVDISA